MPDELEPNKAAPNGVKLNAVERRAMRDRAPGLRSGAPDRSLPWRHADPSARIPGLVIRAAEPDDAPAVARLANLPGFRWGTMRPPFQSVAATRARMEANGEMGGGANQVSILAVLDGEVVGTAGLTRFSGRRSHAGTLGMGVDDERTGQGIGAALLGALLEVADDWWGLRRVELTVYSDNAPAVRLYERLGFEREGVHRAYAMRGGALVDALAMARLRELPPMLPVKAVVTAGRT